MNVTTLRCKPTMAWNERTAVIYQKIEYYIERLQCKCNDTMPDLSNPGLPNSQNFLLDELDRMLRHINDINADIKRLQTLKAWLCLENSSIIGNLLQNNAYLEYDEDQLEKIIRINS